jgi:hypothetical protein
MWYHRLGKWAFGEREERVQGKETVGFVPLGLRCKLLRHKRPQHPTRNVRGPGQNWQNSPNGKGLLTHTEYYSCVPLCSDCHTQAPGAYHRVGKRAFEQRYGLSFARVVERLQREWRAA